MTFRKLSELEEGSLGCLAELGSFALGEGVPGRLAEITQTRLSNEEKVLWDLGVERFEVELSEESKEGGQVSRG